MFKLKGNASRELKRKAIYVLKALTSLKSEDPFETAFPGSENDKDLRKFIVDAEVCNAFGEHMCLYIFRDIL